MSLLAFPDINVWFCLMVKDHVHHQPAMEWWHSTPAVNIAFCRITQLGLLRLLTNAPVMRGKPFTMRQAWIAYDRWFQESRVIWLEEPYSLDAVLRDLSMLDTPSPKLWNDLYLAAFAKSAEADLVTFDQPLHGRSPGSILLS